MFFNLKKNRMVLLTLVIIVVVVIFISPGVIERFRAIGASCRRSSQCGSCKYCNNRRCVKKGPTQFGKKCWRYWKRCGKKKSGYKCRKPKNGSNRDCRWCKTATTCGSREETECVVK